MVAKCTGTLLLMVAKIFSDGVTDGDKKCTATLLPIVAKMYSNGVHDDRKNVVRVWTMS